jgi:hypothetical protein
MEIRVQGQPTDTKCVVASWELECRGSLQIHCVAASSLELECRQRQLTDLKCVVASHGIRVQGQPTDFQCVAASWELE